ncbi:MAG: glycosyltransferase family 1 protein, partial [Pedobacter sp.]
MKKLAIIITHPVQYYVPLFQLLAQRCELKVFYTWGMAGVQPKHDPGFGKVIAWDLPLLAGYDYELLENISTDPGSHHGKGIMNPDIISKIRTFSADAILIYGYIYQSHFKVMRHFKGKIPIWFRGDSTLLDDTTSLKAIAKKLYLKWVYNHVDKAFYVGTNNKAYFKKYGLREQQLVFAPHAIDNERF